MTSMSHMMQPWNVLPPTPCSLAESIPGSLWPPTLGFAIACSEGAPTGAVKHGDKVPGRSEAHGGSPAEPRVFRVLQTHRPTIGAAGIRLSG